MTYAPLTHGLQPCYNQADWKLLESWETVENVWLLSEVMGDIKKNISCNKVYDVQTSDMWFHIVRGHWLYHLTMGTTHVLYTPVTHYLYSNSNILQPWHGRTTSLALSQVPLPSFDTTSRTTTCAYLRLILWLILSNDRTTSRNTNLMIAYHQSLRNHTFISIVST